MTRLPADAYLIEPMRGPEWPAYKVGPLCALDGCSRLTDHAHHIVFRLEQPLAQLGDQGMVVRNQYARTARHDGSPFATTFYPKEIC